MVKRAEIFSKALLKNIKKIIENDSTKESYRTSEVCFTRNRNLSFSNLVYFLLQLGKSSLQQELDLYFDEHFYTKSALSQHRLKLKPELFVDLNRSQCDFYYTKASHVKKWKGYRLVAIDGSTMQLPFSDNLVENYGHFETRTENNRKVVLARISQAYDVLNQISIDAQIDHYRTSELSFAHRHLAYINTRDLLLMDRGYSAFWFMSLLTKKSCNFLIRLKAKRFNVGKTFLASDKKEQIITLTPSNEAVKRCKEVGAPVKPLKLRLVRIWIEGGEDQVLITNLIDQQEHKYTEICKLYQKRWPVEESFKHLKLRAELENLSGKSHIVVQQDFHRIIMRTNLATILSNQMSQKGVKTINKVRNKTYQINRTQAYRKIKKVINTISHSFNKINKQLQLYAIALIKQVERHRPNRSNPRIKRYAGKPANFMCYKP